jgi:uncharacterized protein
MNPVVHFEMPYENKQRMVDFYTKIFGWKAQLLGPEMGNYVLVQTTEMDENNIPKEPGKINGGFYEKSEKNSNVGVVISVDDIYDSMKKVEAAGGTIIGGQKPREPDDIPGIGLACVFLDCEGNKLSMLQPKSM